MHVSVYLRNKNQFKWRGYSSSVWSTVYRGTMKRHNNNTILRYYTNNVKQWPLRSFAVTVKQRPDRTQSELFYLFIHFLSMKYIVCFRTDSFLHRRNLLCDHENLLRPYPVLTRSSVFCACHCNVVLPIVFIKSNTRFRYRVILVRQSSIRVSQCITNSCLFTSLRGCAQY